MSYQTAWGLPEKRSKSAKKSKFDQIVRPFTRKNTLKLKMPGGKSLYFSQGCQYKEKI